MAAAEKQTELSRGDALDLLSEVWALNHAIERASVRMEARLGVTAQQRLLIRLVGRHPGITAGQLATLLCVDASTVSTSLKRLEKRKMLRRRRDTKDARRSIIELLPGGKALDRREGASIEGALEAILEETPDARAAAVREFLRDLVRRIDRIGT
ncbi:MAG: MarR family transcriptional regulator [Myxococcaceae bacterium]|nr:MarR family transcriptional regulator [Myxococcaceae bacterium]